MEFKPKAKIGFRSRAWKLPLITSRTKVMKTSKSFGNIPMTPVAPASKQTASSQEEIKSMKIGTTAIFLDGAQMATT